MLDVIENLENKGKKLYLRHVTGECLNKSVRLLKEAEAGESASLWYQAAEEVAILSKLVYDFEENEKAYVWGGETEPTREMEAGLADIWDMVEAISKVRAHIDKRYAELGGR